MDLRKNDRIEIGLRVKERREQLELRQEDLEERSGVSRSTISHIESGDRFPSWPNAIKLGNALGISPAELADVTSPSMLYLVRAIAEKLEIPLHPPIPADEDESQEQLHDHLSELDRLATTEDQEEGSAQPREGTGRS